MNSENYSTYNESYYKCPFNVRIEDDQTFNSIVIPLHHLQDSLLGVCTAADTTGVAQCAYILQEDCPRAQFQDLCRVPHPTAGIVQETLLGDSLPMVDFSQSFPNWTAPGHHEPHQETPWWEKLRFWER